MSVRELAVYQAAIANILDCENLDIHLDRRFTDEKRQLLRAARSIPALLTEGYAKRISQKEFLRYVLMALGSSDEVQTHLYILQISRFNHLGTEVFEHIITKYSLLSRQLNVMTQAISANIRYPVSEIRHPLSGRRKLTR